MQEEEIEMCWSEEEVKRNKVKFITLNFHIICLISFLLNSFSPPPLPLL